MAGLSPKLPLVRTPEDGPYGLNKTFLETTKQNFKNLLLTIPGERVMDRNFGIGLKRFLFEPDATFLRDEIEGRIRNQLKQYLPHVVLVDVEFQSSLVPSQAQLDSHVLGIRLVYRVEPFNQNDFLDITVE
tara:strand:+ start:224 stop:616 length:393 start_codon:yes stop_codon:yes gene_type:complete